MQIPQGLPSQQISAHRLKLCQLKSYMNNANMALALQSPDRLLGGTLKYVVCLSAIALIITLAVKLRGQPSTIDQADESSPEATVVKSMQVHHQSKSLEAVALPDLKQPQTGEDQLEEILYERDLQELFGTIPKLETESPTQFDGHGFMSIELKEAEALSQIQEYISKNKNFPAVTQKLYRQCTDDRELATTVRALCYFHVLELSSQLHNTNEVAKLEVPAEIKKMAEELYN